MDNNSTKKKPLRLKDLIPVDYTDDSWPEDELGQLSYDYYKRVTEVTNKEVEVSKHELNGHLQRINARIKHIHTIHHDEFPAAVSKELDSLMKHKEEIIKMLKEQTHQLDEALTLTQRMKRRAIMRKNKAKIAMGRKRAQRRRASNIVLQKRAIRAARNILAKKLLRKSKDEASYSEKVRVEKILAKRQSAIQRIARKLLPQIRKKEMQKFNKQSASPAATPASK